MAVDFGLLNTNLPVTGPKPMDLNTPTQNAQAVYNMEGKKLDVAEKQQEFQQGNQDQAALKEAMADPQNNLATPDGMANLLKTVQGKVTPKTLMGLADHAQKVKANDIALNESVMKMDEQARKNYSESFEYIASEMDDVYAEYHQNLKTMGKEAADKIYKEKTAPIVQKYAGVKLPNGTPLVPPALINNVQNGDVNMIDAMYANSQHVKNKLDAADKQAQVEQRIAEAAAKNAAADALKPGQGPGKGAETFLDKDGNTILQSKSHPEEFYKLGPGGVPQRLAGAPEGLRKIGSASEVKREEEGAAKIPPEKQKILTDYALLNPLPHPSARLSPAAAAAWNISLADSIAEAGGSKVAAMDALTRKADAAALRVQTNQSAAIENTTRDIKFNMGGIEDELRKLGGPDSPKVRALLQTAVNDWEGGPEYSALKTYMTNLQEQTGRLFSRATGAAGTPVGFLNLAKELNNGNMNLEQFLKSKDAIGKLADWSLKSATQEKETLLKDMEGHFKNSGGGTKVDPKDQKARDSDAAKIISDEVPRILSDYVKSSPEDRDRKWKDLKAIRKEQMRAGALQMAPGGPGSKAGDVAKGADGLHIFKGGTWNKKENWELLDAK